MRRPVFFSFHYENDVMRVQQIRNIGMLEDNTPVSPNDWETVKRGGNASIKNWIDNNMKYKQCVIVLIGEDTANRPWVRYEIEHAYNSNKPIFGIYIHNLRCPQRGISRKGSNPFDHFSLNNGQQLSTVVQCYDPFPLNAYNNIAQNMENWVSAAIAQRR